MTLPASRCLDVTGAARFFSVKPRTIWRLVDRGTLKPVRLPGLRKVLFRLSDLEALVTEWRDA